MKSLPLLFILGGLSFFLVFGCKEYTAKVESPQDPKKVGVVHASGFTIEEREQYHVLQVTSPWPETKKTFTYALVPKSKLSAIALPKDTYNAIIGTPVERIVVTSTTHIPALESLGNVQQLVGFPDTQYISSPVTREQIKNGAVKELGTNENLNTELVLELDPEVVVGFGVSSENKAYHTIEKAGIAVMYNGDWTEQTPLGKAEWIKFFGALFHKEKKADSIFNSIVKEYEKVKALAQKATERPTVLSGALYKDVWYLPAGKSWAAQFLKDAGTVYLWKDTAGTGSLSLSLETVLTKGQYADFWISPSQFTTYLSMKGANPHYTQFAAYQKQKIFTFAATRGETGGLLYYELAPQRPDLVLKDLVHIFHPTLLPNHRPYFFNPMQ